MPRIPSRHFPLGLPENCTPLNMFIKLAFVFSLTALFFALSSLVSAHPGEEFSIDKVAKNANVRYAAADVNQHALDRCINEGHVQERRRQAMRRRMATFERLRIEQGVGDGKMTAKYYLYHRSSSQG
jgi:hypothetical protein